MKNNIIELCENKDIKISKLIKETGLSKSYVYSIIRGKSIPTIKTARIISNVLEVTLEEAFPEEDLKGGMSNE